MDTMIRRRAMLGTLLTAIAAPVALAQPGPGAGSGMGPGGGYGMMGGGWNVATYLTGLKQELGITAAQEPAWKAYADTVTGVGEQMQALHQTMFESMGTASWEERRNLMNAMFDARKQAFQMVQEAADTLLPHLTEAQRARAKTELPGLDYGYHRGWGRSPAAPD